MLPQKHVMISAVIGSLSWLGTGEVATGVAALVAGVLPDVDHIVDYAYYHWQKQHRLILLLHGYEYAMLGALLAMRLNSKVLWVATFSYLVHLAADQLENKTRRLGYSLFFRAWHQFRIEAISTMPEAAARGRMDDLRAIEKLLRRWRR
jgi:hypothetical protein